MKNLRPARIAIAATSIALPVATALLAGRSYSISEQAISASYDSCLGRLGQLGESVMNCAIQAQVVGADALEASSLAEWTWLAFLLTCCWYLSLIGTALWRWATKPAE